MFQVSDDNFISKNQLKIAVLQMQERIGALEKLSSNLMFELFCENTYHPFFKQFSEPVLNKSRTLKFNRKR